MGEGDCQGSRISRINSLKNNPLVIYLCFNHYYYYWWWVVLGGGVVVVVVVVVMVSDFVWGVNDASSSLFALALRL